MSTPPADRKYTRTHEWVKVDGDIATIGITDHAQSELGDIVYLSLPEAGRLLQREAQFGEVESVKAVSELFSPVSGEVTEANTAITDRTETVNEDPYGAGWLVRVRVRDASELANLLDAASYARETDGAAH